MHLYEVLTDLHEWAFYHQFEKILDEIYSRLPVLELAAASSHGEQAVANLLKLRMIASEMDDRPQLTFSEFVNRLVSYLDQQPSETEQALAEESLESVRVLTIHKAKGLEFPVVILPGFHHGTQFGYEEASSIVSDWATGLVGISVGPASNVGAVLIKEKMRRKDEAEYRRLLYVAMTRAQERLIISGGCTKRSGSGTFLQFLQSVTTSQIGAPDCQDIVVGSESFPHVLVTPTKWPSIKSEKMTHEMKSPSDLTPWLQELMTRKEHWQVCRESSMYLAPTSPKRYTYPASMERAGAKDGDLIGKITHRVLESWEFVRDNTMLQHTVQEVCAREIPSDQMAKTNWIVGEVHRILEKFFSSSIYAKLEKVNIVGREVPFSIPWDCVPGSRQDITKHSCVMEGVIDLVYEEDGKFWVADYKTDCLTEDELLAKVTQYQEQMAVYKVAVQRCLGIPHVYGQLIFLRLTQAIQV